MTKSDDVRRRTAAHRKSKSFRGQGTIRGTGPTGAWCHLFLPADASTFLGRRGQVNVLLTVEKCEFRRTAKPDGKGGHFILFNSAMRAQTGARAGDVVEFALRPDPGPRIPAVPEALRKSLAGLPQAAAAFAALPGSHRKAYIEFIAEAKKAATRERRVDTILKKIEGWAARHSSSRGGDRDRSTDVPPCGGRSPAG